MIITALTLENFKGIREPITIEFKPVTLLFGPNSAGKSTIIQALHYAHEIFERRNLDPDRTLEGGRSMDLGGFQSLVHDHDLDSSIKLRLDLDLAKTPLPTFYDDYDFADSEVYDGLVGYEPVSRWEIRAKSGWVEIEVCWNSEISKPFIGKYSVGLDGELVGSISFDQNADESTMTTLNCFHPRFIRHSDTFENAIESCLLFWQEDPTRFTSGYQQTVEQGAIALTRAIEDIGSWFNPETVPDGEFPRLASSLITFCLLARDSDVDDIFSILNQYENDKEKYIEYIKRFMDMRAIYEYRKGSHLSDIDWKGMLPKEIEESIENLSRLEFWMFLREPLELKLLSSKVNIRCIGQKDALPELGKPLPLSENRNHAMKYGLDYRSCLAAINQAFVGLGMVVKEALGDFLYLGPLREIPERYFRPVSSPQSTRWSTGLAAWDELNRRPDKFIDQVNAWLSGPYGLKSGYSLVRKRYKELDTNGWLINRIVSAIDDPHWSEMIREEIDRLPIRTNLYLVNEANDIELLPQDIGVGISKVLPVIVAALSAQSGIVAIEEPESNIHPAFQTELGDLFISEIKRKNICFLIETHSEHLLLRMLRRIRETTDNEVEPGRPEMTPDQLSVYFVESIEGQARFVGIGVDEDGEFKDRWPRGFFRERLEEL